MCITGIPILLTARLRIMRAISQGTPLPDDWITDDIFREHLLHIGPHCANEINMWNDDTFPQWPKHPGRLEDREAAKHLIDLYDDGVALYGR